MGERRPTEENRRGKKGGKLMKKKKNGVRMKKNKETFFVNVLEVGKKMWQQMGPINLSPIL